MYDRLKELKFYGDGDESGELWQATCNLAYKMCGAGETEKAELLFTWAKEQSDSNLEWCLENDVPLDYFVTGDRCC